MALTLSQTYSKILQWTWAINGLVLYMSKVLPLIFKYKPNKFYETLLVQ